MTQANNAVFINQKVRRIRVQVSTVLKKWGLLPRFKRWRVTQDPGTGMIVLFGILNNKYIAQHTSIPFRDYFDPRLLHDLANELQVEVVSCNSDGLRYAFILGGGNLGRMPTHIDFPFLEGDRLFARVVYEVAPAASVTDPQSPAAVRLVTDKEGGHISAHQGAQAFLKVFDDLHLPPQSTPHIVVIDQAEFNERISEQEANRQRNNRLRRKFYNATGYLQE